MKAASMVLLFLCAKAAWGSIGSDEEYRENAAYIVELHTSNRSDDVFMGKFATYTIGIFAEATEAKQRGVPAQQWLKGMILFYFNAKLCAQYARDHAATLDAKTTKVALDLGTNCSTALRINGITLPSDEINAFRKPFSKDPTFRLRSL